MGKYTIESAMPAIKVMKNLFLVILIFGVGQFSTAQSQIELTPLTENPQLQAERDNHKQLLSILDAPSRSNEDPEIIRISIPSGGEAEHCFDWPFPAEEIESIQNLNCADLSFTVVAFSDDCISITAENVASNIETDTLCLMLTGSEGTELEYIVIISVRPIRTLPFVDDFSYQGPFPDIRYWTDQNVFVNTTLSKNPPSVGVATFDGLDSKGAPYGGGFGTADVLTSSFIDMTTAINNQCYLTFFIQAGGLSYFPKSDDVLILEFKTQSGDWEEVAAFDPENHPEDDSFYFKSIQLESRFFYGDFQFRFTNFADGIGMNTTWNLDYVKLANEFQVDLIFENDIAFTRLPSNALSRYSAMPLNQFLGFEAEELRDEVEIEVFNHFNATRQADPSQLLIEEVSDPVLLSETLLEVPPIADANQRDLPYGRHTFLNDIQNANIYLNNIINLVDEGREKLILQTNYSFQQNEEQIQELMRNNSVAAQTVLDNYFAYDDQSAERGININYAGGPFPSLALQYHANKGDTLRGIAISLPRLNASDQNKRFQLKVWGASLDDPPLFESEEMRPTFVDVFHDSIQGFSTYALKSVLTGKDTAIYIPAGDFYVGWTQISRDNRGVPVGFDLNNPEKSRYLYWSDGVVWRAVSEVNPSIQGAVMIRPLFTESTPVSTYVENINSEIQTFSPYPNPTTNQLFLPDYIEMDPTTTIEIYDLNGKMMKKLHPQKTLDLNELSSGTFIILIRGTKDDKTHLGKFIKL